MDELLMRTGTIGWCPDCADERILVGVEDGLDYCCTDCDAAVLLFHVPSSPALQLSA